MSTPSQFDDALLVLEYLAERHSVVKIFLAGLNQNLTAVNRIISPKSKTQACHRILNKTQRCVPRNVTKVLYNEMTKWSGLQPRGWPKSRHDFDLGITFWMTGKLTKNAKVGRGNANKQFTEDERLICSLVDAGVPAKDLKGVIAKMVYAQEWQKHKDLCQKHPIAHQVLRTYEQSGPNGFRKLQENRLAKALQNLAIKN